MIRLPSQYRIDYALGRVVRDLGYKFLQTILLSNQTQIRLVIKG